MRVGISDTKQNARSLGGFKRHRVILPVYIPRLEGYFARSLEILRLCVRSLVVTGGGNVSITLVGNQCCSEAIAELQMYYTNGWVDQLVLNFENRGRVDAVAALARGSYEDVLTVADCDVLFKPGWVEAIERLFNEFPECAVVSIVPHPGVAWYHTATTVLGASLRNELAFDKVVSDQDIDRFGVSIGVPDYVKPEQRAIQMIVRRNGIVACVGAPHFVFSVRRAAVGCIPTEPSYRALDTYSDEVWLDRPPDLYGYWRLATPQAYACHMGNVPEPWMHEELERWSGAGQPAVNSVRSLDELAPMRRPLEGRIPWKVRDLLVRALRKAWLERAFRNRARAVQAASFAVPVHGWDSIQREKTRRATNVN